MRHIASLGLCLLSFALRADAPPDAIFAQRELLFRGDFRGPLAQWTSELEKPGKVEARAGVLNIDAPAGCTVWFRAALETNVMIQYDARMVSAGGPNDRVSDLNAFWMASDARSPGDLFGTRRSGQFSDYNQLRAYYVGQGGNSNTTTRFRRYIGDAVERPLLPAHDLRDAKFLLRPNVWQTVRLVALGKRIQYFRDRQLIFDFVDEAPYTQGHFALRTTASHLNIRNFAIYRIAARP
jgi:hypothetical protein